MNGKNSKDEDIEISERDENRNNDVSDCCNQSPVSKYIFTNIQGLRHLNNNKVPFIGGLLKKTGALFAAFTETHSRKCLDSELWIDGYNLFRSERELRECGGCCLYTHESLICSEVLKSTNDMVELLIVKVENMNLIIIVLYRPPNALLQKFEQQLNKIEEYLKSINRPSPNIMLLGDFNFPHLQWGSQDGQAKITEVTGTTRDVKSQAHHLFRLCNDYNLSQFVYKRTRKNNTLDLIFTNNEDLVHYMEVTPTIFSDHNIIEVTSRLNITRKELVARNCEDGFSVFNFNKSDIDWDALNHCLTDIDWNRNGVNSDETAFLQFLSVSAVTVCKSRIKKRAKRRPKFVRYVRGLYKRRGLISMRLGANRISVLHRNKLGGELAVIERKLKLYYRNQAEEEERKLMLLMN